jgi:hypothetical protein
VRRRWPAKKLRDTNDVVGAYGNVIGMTYAVILAFMLSGVWSNYNEALRNSQLEANALVQVFRLAEALPPRKRQTIQGLARTYARIAIDVEWREMEGVTLGPAGKQVHDRLWGAVLAVHPRDAAETATMSQMLADLSEVTRHRAEREFEMHLALPGILWVVLVFGGIITIGIFALFGVEDWRLHMIKSVALTGLICLVLVAIAEIDQPFQGAVRVPPEAFRLADATFDRLRNER